MEDSPQCIVVGLPPSNKKIVIWKYLFNGKVASDLGWNLHKGVFMPTFLLMGGSQALRESKQNKKIKFKKIFF